MQQHNERKSTRFTGVHQRESRSKRHHGKPDTCYSIDYCDPQSGKRIRKTIGWRSEGITAEYAHSVRLGLLSHAKQDKYSGFAPQDEKKVITLDRAWALYHDEWLVPRHIKSAGTDKGIYKNHLAPWGGRKRLNQIMTYDLEALSAELFRKGLSAQTVKHVLALLRRIMRKMVNWKRWRGPLPFDAFTMPKVSNERTRYLTPYEARAVLEALKGLNARMWIISLISLHCGLRFSEVARLKRYDLDFENKSIHVRDTKSGKDRHAIMTNTVFEALNDFHALYPATLLFPTQRGTIMTEKYNIFDDVINAFELNAGITDRRHKIVFHSLRHTYASWLAMAGNGQSDIAELLGHSSLDMSKRYTHLMPDSRKKAAGTVDSLFNDAEHQGPQM